MFSWGQVLVKVNRNETDLQSIVAALTSSEVGSPGIRKRSMGLEEKNAFLNKGICSD